MRNFLVFACIILGGLLSGCSGSQPLQPALSSPGFDTPTTPPESTATSTATPTPLPARPLTIIFYGDSLLKVGEVGRQGEVGFSFADNLDGILDPGDHLITANYGGRRAQWGYENLEQNILGYNPDIVTIWWGMNDLYGCPGFFDRETGNLLEYKLDGLIAEHIKYLKLQIDALQERSIPVIIMTPMPVLGEFPWTHFSPANELVWELDHRCDYNLGLAELAKAQRELVQTYSGRVALLDTWQIYMEHPNTDKMYMDIMHPGSRGAALLADEWLRPFKSMER